MLSQVDVTIGVQLGLWLIFFNRLDVVRAKCEARVLQFVPGGRESGARLGGTGKDGRRHRQSQAQLVRRRPGRRPERPPPPHRKRHHSGPLAASGIRSK